MLNTVVGLIGSLRAGSFNRKLMQACVPMLDARLTLEVVGIDGIPLYDGDVESSSGVPPAVTALKDRIAASAALLIASPEYNNSIPGPLKNALDWLTRPPGDIARVFGGRIVGVIGASPGRFGTLSAQQAWSPILRTLGTVPYFGEKLMVGAANTVFAADGSIADAGTRDRVQQYLDGFAAFALKHATNIRA
jgi:chromate reductase, NAD(P)H dehydrogenase (quinone)